jgi:hypothetical protein
MHLITITRPSFDQPPTLTVYQSGKPVVAVTLTQREHLELIKQAVQEYRQ